jgi:hypothetical protein
MSDGRLDGKVAILAPTTTTSASSVTSLPLMGRYLVSSRAPVRAISEKLTRRSDDSRITYLATVVVARYSGGTDASINSPVQYDVLAPLGFRTTNFPFFTCRAH